MPESKGPAKRFDTVLDRESGAEFVVWFVRKPKDGVGQPIYLLHRKTSDGVLADGPTLVPEDEFIKRFEVIPKDSPVREH